MKKAVLSLFAVLLATAAVFTTFRSADAQAPAQQTAAQPAPGLQEYVLLSGFNDAETLSRNVTARLKEGWRLHGGHSAVMSSGGSVVFTQALVR